MALFLFFFLVSIVQSGYCLINLTSAVEFLESATASQLTIDEASFHAHLDAAEQRVQREDILQAERHGPFAR